MPKGVLRPAIPTDTEGSDATGQAQKIDKELYECLQTRATVQVRYAPDQPDMSMLDERWVAVIKGASST